MEPVNVYLDSDTQQEGIIRGKRFKVPDFSGDGVYALEVTAVDTAGNRSELNVSTYAVSYTHLDVYKRQSYVSGIYGRIESALDLKYNSAFVTMPIILSAVLAVICFFVGFLMYFHKYKRQKTRSLFGEQFRNVLEQPDDGGRQEGNS